MNYKNNSLYILLRSQYYKAKEISDEIPVRFKISSRKLCEKSLTIENSQDFIQIINELLKYVKQMRVGKHLYQFSQSAGRPSLFSSVYAILIYHLLDVPLDRQEKNGWEEFFDSYQESDGMWRDSENPFRLWQNQSDEWNDIHLHTHMLWCYHALNILPKKRFKFLDRFLDEKEVENFCNSLDFTNIWGASNGLMNYLCCMEYVRDYMGETEFDRPIRSITGFLKQKMRKEGVWYEGDLNIRSNQYNAIRGAYHIWPILLYENEPIRHKKEVIDFILPLQNRFGGWDSSVISSACADIDCIDPLIRFSNMVPGYKEKEVREALIKSLQYQLFNQNRDGGFSFEMGKNMRYGNDSLVSNKGESNMFATWFRLLTVLIIAARLYGYPVVLMPVSGLEYFKEIIV